MTAHSDADTGELLLSLARRIRRGFLAAVAAYDVTPTQARALRVILAAEGPIRPSHIADRLRMAPRTVTELVDGLEQAGLVIRAPDPGDRRALLLTATPAGRRLGAVIEETRRETAARLLDGLSEQDRIDLHRILAILGEQP